MSALNNLGSKDSGRGNSESPTDQPAEKSVLPPFSGKLSVDKNLKLSHETFKQTVHDFFKGKNVTPLSQLAETPAFPTPYELAQFASKAYRDHKPGETDAQYETRLALPAGWKLLTTACNTGRNNGYFGAAYWHPEHQQVVIAHRGTDPKNWGALWTDVKGVLLNKYARQMESASTFACKVVDMLREVNQENGTNFQVFFTGHSLGGWLAQITTFTTEYLKTEGNTFLKSDNVPQSYHPHTVVFDSPGCKDMLSQMADKLDVRLDGRSIDIEHLDITSYLSAPNRVNTCNAHVGTVYRIFVDLSNMGWLEKHTALYNLAMHSMNKIVEAFDPETGQVRKDEEGKLKIQEVVDWPISGFRRGREYECFFKWATHLNDYHTEITVEDSLFKGYHPIRYQTKNYDDRETSISVFSKEERRFLEDYRRLCQLPEFFKPKEMFSAIGNKETQEQAEKKLQSFEIENETILCTDASALQALIPYVKRLLQLFPEIKENTWCALSPHEVRNNVYQIGTKRYLEKLHRSQLEFKPDALSLEDFLNSDEQKVLHLRMVYRDAWTGLIKVYHVLQKTPSVADFRSEGHYTVLTLEHLLLVNQMVNLSTFVESTTTPHLLMMSCETSQLSNDETKQTFESLFNTVRQKQSIKIILATQSKDDTLDFLQDVAKDALSNGFVTIDGKLTWTDLTQSSQEKLLENAVYFQGSEIALNKLISADSSVTNFLPLADLLDTNILKIGEEPIAHSIYDFYDERHYIERTFHQQVIIKQDVLNDNMRETFPDLLASTEQEFQQHCQTNTENNVHWLERDKSGKLVWQQSKGSLEKLRKYIDTDSWHTHTPGDLDKLLEQAHKQRVMLISDTAGMGKSTVLTHLSKQIKQKFPAKWVVRIDLNDHTDALEALQEEQIGKEKAIEFVSEKILKLKPGFERELFKQSCEQKQKVDIVIMVDGFDEISPNYEDTVIALLQALRQTAVEQLWVTTRPHLREELEDRLQQLSYTLEPFSEENQVDFLTKFWSLKDWFTDMDNTEKEERKFKLEIYAKHLIKKLAQSISDGDNEFTGIPLQCRMLAEAFDEEVKTFCQSAVSGPALPFQLNLLGLYEKFLYRKYDICFEEKFKFLKTIQGLEPVRTEFVESITKVHQILALRMLFDEEKLALLQINSQCTFSDEDLTRTGIVQVSRDGKLHFIHRTFAEYYVALFSVNQLEKVSNTSQQVQDHFFREIFLGVNHQVAAFTNGLLPRTKPSEEILKQYGNWISLFWRKRSLKLHQAAYAGHVHIIGFLIKSVQAADHTDTVKKMLLEQDGGGRTAWYVAADSGKVQVLGKLWKWATEELTDEELKNQLFLARGCRTDILDFAPPFRRYINDKTAWHLAAEKGDLQVFQKIWEWGKQTLTAEELKNKLLLAKDKEGLNAWHYASLFGNAEALQKLWEWGKETLTAEELNNNLLLAKHNEGQTAWHFAAKKGKIEILEKLWDWGKETLTAEDLNNKLLLAKDNVGQTAWHLAAKKAKIEILQKLWEWGMQTLRTEDVKNKLLLARNSKEQTACHYVISCGSVSLLQKLWECGKETLTAEELTNKLLLATDNVGQTAWHLAAENGKGEILEKLWECGKEILSAEELNTKLLLAEDNVGKTAWQLAAERCKLEALEKLWEWGKGTLTAEELNNKLLLAKDNKGQTAYYCAIFRQDLELLQKLWDWVKETKLPAEELKNKLLLAKDNDGETVWQYASRWCQVAALGKVWEWGKETLTAEELTNELLLIKDSKGRTAWHYATRRENLPQLQTLLEWGKETLTAEELNSKLLLDKDSKERTALHYASRWSSERLLQKVWDWSKETLTADELNNKFLLAKDNEGQTALHYVSRRNNVKLLEKLFEWGKETLTAEELNNKFVLSKDNNDQTAWHYVARRCNGEHLQKLWEWGKETLTAEELNNELLLAKNSVGQTAWYLATVTGNTEILQKLWEWGKETLTAEELNNRLLLAKDKMGQTAWHLAAMEGNIEMSKKLWEWGKETLSVEELSNKLLLAKDNKEQTVWRLASKRGSVELLQKLWEWGKETLTAEELKHKLLLAKDFEGQIAWHYVTLWHNIEALQKLLECSKETLTLEDLNSKFLVTKDFCGRTAWHYASWRGSVEQLEKLWECGKETLTAEELSNNLLLGNGFEERTAWHYAFLCGNVKVLQKLWEWGKDTLTSEELSNKLLLAKDKNERTAWHYASQRGNVDLLQKLWEWGKEILTEEELNSKFLQAKDIEERTGSVTYIFPAT